MNVDFSHDSVKTPEKNTLPAQLSSEQWTGNHKLYDRTPSSGDEAKLSLASVLGKLTITDSRKPVTVERIVADNSIKTASGDLASSGHAIAAVAQSLDGRKLWRSSKYARATEHGKYGCAASLSLALEKAGYRYADSPTVGGLVGQLNRHGWTVHPASEAHEGDVIVAFNQGTKWKNGGGNAHIGIVTADGNVYNNSKRQDEKWVAENPDLAFEQYNSRYVLRPPHSRGSRAREQR